MEFKTWSDKSSLLKRSRPSKRSSGNKTQNDEDIEAKKTQPARKWRVSKYCHELPESSSERHARVSKRNSSTGNETKRNDNVVKAKKNRGTRKLPLSESSDKPHGSSPGRYTSASKRSSSTGNTTKQNDEMKAKKNLGTRKLQLSTESSDESRKSSRERRTRASKRTSSSKSQRDDDKKAKKNQAERKSQLSESSDDSYETCQENSTKSFRESSKSQKAKKNQRTRKLLLSESSSDEHEQEEDNVEKDVSFQKLVKQKGNNKMKKKKFVTKKERLEQSIIRQLRKKLCFIDDQINMNLVFANCDIERCIDAMDDLDKIPITQLLLKDDQNFVQTIKRCRKFKESKLIRSKAKYLYSKIKSAFTLVEGKSSMASHESGPGISFRSSKKTSSKKNQSGDDIESMKNERNRKCRQFESSNEDEQNEDMTEEKDVTSKNELKTKLCDIDDEIRQSLTFASCDIEKCVDNLEKFDQMPISLMLMRTKVHKIVQTIEKARKCKGSERIRMKAEYLHHKIENVLMQRESSTSSKESTPGTSTRYSRKISNSKIQINKDIEVGKSQRNRNVSRLFESSDEENS